MSRIGQLYSKKELAAIGKKDRESLQKIRYTPLSNFCDPKNSQSRQSKCPQGAQTKTARPIQSVEASPTEEIGIGAVPWLDTNSSATTICPAAARGSKRDDAHGTTS
jgi:hypothetical protein